MNLKFWEVNEMTVYQVAYHIGIPVPELGRKRYTRDEFVSAFGRLPRGMQ